MIGIPETLLWLLRSTVSHHFGRCQCRRQYLCANKFRCHSLSSQFFWGDWWCCHLCHVHKVRCGPYCEQGRSVRDLHSSRRLQEVLASDKSLTLAGAINFIPPDYIAFPTPILTCPRHSLFFNDVFISAHHSFGLLAQNISLAWNVTLSSDFGYSQSLNSNFPLVDENVNRISASNFENRTCPLASANCSVELHVQVDIFFNSSSGEAPLVLNETFKNPSITKLSRMLKVSECYRRCQK